MKKILSFVLAAIMTVSVFALSVVPAMAASVNSPTASTASTKGPTLQVNGAPTSTGVTFDRVQGDTIKFDVAYTGAGTVSNWENNFATLGFTAGTDYSVTENADGTLTVELLSTAAYDAWENGDVILDVIVKTADGSTSAVATTASGSGNDSSKSPATGMPSAVIAGSVAVAFAGVAVLAATKKKAD